MIDKLVELVQQYAGNTVINNSAVPNEKNEAAISSIADGVFNGLKSEATGAGLGSILNMLSSGGNISSAITKTVQSSVIESLISKTGIAKSAASGIAASIVPSILGSLSKNTADASNKGFDISNILSSLTGGATSGLNVSNLLDRNGDGKLDFNDLSSMLSSGSETTTATGKKKTQVGSSSSSGGGLLGGLLGNLFGKK
ncbi:MAG: DUF937 domain-containing protein [Dysgonamonadaceae bacterium]|jgi:hypothetical protein|nr:DUF937 domain-containing protein [Dysgonamonadaceae bacterium]